MVALHERQRCGSPESQSARLFRAGAEAQQPLQALAALEVGSSQLPVAPERGAHPQTDVRLVFFGRPGQRCAQVVAFGVEPLEPAQLLRPEQRRFGVLRERKIEARVATPHGMAVAALLQPFERVLADRLQHPEAGLAAGHRLRPQQVVVQQRLDAGGHVEREVPRNRLRALEAEAPDEDAEAREQCLLLRAEEVVAPFDRSAQRPVPLGQAGAGLRLQVLEPPFEALENVVRREQLDARGSELECQREPVEADTQLGDGAGVHLGELEVGPCVACPSDEQPHRFGAPEKVDFEGVGRVGELERRDAVDPLCGDVERRAAGDEQRQAGCIREQPAEHRRCVEQVLEVVEHDERPPAAQRGDEDFQGSAVGPLDQAERADDRRRDEVGVADWGEVDEHHAARELCVETCRGLDREPRLARPGRSRQRQKTHVRFAQQRADLPLLPAPTHERGRSRSQPRGRPGIRSHSSDVQLRILIEDRPLEIAQRRPRLDPELLDQGGPRRPVRVKRFGLPARAVEREHELAAQALGQRVLGDQALELSDELAARPSARSASIRSCSAAR